ncbi:hypothetical protein PC128_g22884 [Phytophthora cactorum]|nr:hypothetical protein PI125_g1150 [Phytophthora idaei]KAG3151954.1 hypothetical protein PC128_g22884 [Phytophthora cactorum]KAG3169112.1 hypothetical protein PI126_g2959 [Phytophthora idaei]KAG4042587.1 hypothetical protein PC123_g21921 [Phytophthora cactorum]
MATTPQARYAASSPTESVPKPKQQRLAGRHSGYRMDLPL